MVPARQVVLASALRERGQRDELPAKGEAELDSSTYVEVVGDRLIRLARWAGSCVESALTRIFHPPIGRCVISNP